MVVQGDLFKNVLFNDRRFTCFEESSPDTVMQKCLNLKFQNSLAAVYPVGQFYEVDASPLSLQKQPEAASGLVQRGVGIRQES